MQNGNGKLKIYTVISPNEEIAEQKPRTVRLNWGWGGAMRKRQKKDAKQPVKVEIQKTHPEPVPSQIIRPQIEKTQRPKLSRSSIPKLSKVARTKLRKSPSDKQQKPMTATQKLLRNTAVACALLLTVMALQNINQPWTRSATETIKQAVTMRIDLDESLGRLNFVRGLVPEAALVFWNMGSSNVQTPVNGTVAHEYSQMQPWVEFVCSPQEPVLAAQAGTVSAVGQGAAGDWTLMLEHEDGVQTVYAYMAQVLVKPGQQLTKGEQLGLTQDQEASRLYFEMRKDGVAQDPSKGVSP